MDRPRRARLRPDKRPDYDPPRTRPARTPRRHRPFIMQADGRLALAPAGLVDGPLPTHYEPQDSPVRNPLYPSSRATPRAGCCRARRTSTTRTRTEPGADVYPFVVTTYRLTEHFTAGGMTRWTPYLAELQPEMFCEVSPELAELRGLEHGGWATIVTARNAIEARVLVTARMAPLQVAAARSTRSACRTTGAPTGYAQGDAANELTADRAGPERAHPGGQGADRRHPARAAGRRGRRLPEFVAAYRGRAGVTEHTGTEI